MLSTLPLSHRVLHTKFIGTYLFVFVGYTYPSNEFFRLHELNTYRLDAEPFACWTFCFLLLLLLLFLSVIYSFKTRIFHEYHQSVKQFGSRSARLNVGPIWVQTVSKGCQQTTLAAIELITSIMVCFLIKIFFFYNREVLIITSLT